MPLWFGVSRNRPSSVCIILLYTAVLRRGVKRKDWEEKSGQTAERIEKIKTHLVGNKFAGEKGAKQKSRIARSGNGR